jgi:hypothetical protein
MQELVDAVREIVPDACVIVLFGSRASGNNDDHSDIDLLVIVEDCPMPCRRQFNVEVGPLDLHILTAEDLAQAFSEERVSCQSFYTNAIATGNVIYGFSRTISILATEAREYWPRRRIETSWLGMRFVLGGRISDLRREVDPGERLLLASGLAESLLSVQCLLHRGWLASAAIMRRWLEHDRAQAMRQMDLALMRAAAGDFILLQRIAWTWLNLIGGPPGALDVLNADGTDGSPPIGWNDPNMSDGRKPNL